MLKTTKPSFSNGRVNKTTWILSQPAETSAKEVVEKAEAAGISLSLAHVYTARSNAKRNGAAAVTTPAPANIRHIESPSTVEGLRKEFLSLTFRIGTDKAQKLLRSLSKGTPTASV
jgi:hypothetical protein